LDKLDQLASTGSPTFYHAIKGFRYDLANQLNNTDLFRPIPPSPFAIALEALKLWVEDDGKTWGASADTADFDSSAGCYIPVKGEANKCNIFVGEVVYLATGVTFKNTPGENGKFVPYRARDWATSTTQIPHFGVTYFPNMGDIWAIRYPHTFSADGGHTGIYLGEHYGIKVYISARSSSDAPGIGTVQRENGIQIKELIPPDGIPMGGTYREYSP